jgi:acetyl-CoA/propionyl-CoA carboxylase biotin carboxyl carrier protein
MFTTVLVANRGEIAVRVLRTLRRLGIRSVAVYSDADSDARHVAEADMAVRIGPAPAAESYLDPERIVAAALAAGAEAVHPGYGFLSENATLAARCAASGITFVGPPVRAIEVMGDKINAKAAVAAAGVPVVPGLSGAGLDDGELAAAALEVGLPVLLKPSAGGGGKGMRRVDDAAGLAAEITSARREALGAFGDGTLLVERWVTRPRHVEIQVFADSLGHCVHLGERECSLQRRHQKVIEEAPSVLLDEATRAAMGASAVAAARSVGYVGAGTVEFIVSAERPDEYFFLEMNTRLQVEHPVTEAVTGLDLVELQLRVAAGLPLGFDQDDVRGDGHAVEARIYAEDASRGFLPAAGTVLALREPTGRDGVRVDSSLRVGTAVGTEYDPLLAKIIAHGRDREEALARLDAALGATAILGVTTNTAFLRRLLAHPDVTAGRLDTELIGREAVTLSEPARPDAVLVAAALDFLLARAPGGPVVDPWDQLGGWRLGAPAEAIVELVAGGEVVEVGVTGPPDAAEVRVGDGPAVAAAAHRREPGGAEAAGGSDIEVTVDGVTQRYAVAADGAARWLGAGGAAWRLGSPPRPGAGRSGAGGAGGPVTSPMPGTVLGVHVEVGDRVGAGQPLVTVEAMKMEYAVAAPAAGVVTALHVRTGQSVALEQALAEVEPGEADA